MKFFLIAAFLALTCVTYAAGKDIELTDEQKQKLMSEIMKNLEKETGKKCMDELTPNILDTAYKYITKIKNGEPFFKQDGKERSLKDYVTHSKLYKTATNETCKKSFKKTVGKAIMFGLKAAGIAVIGFFG